jgi:hypothetical protein
MRSFRHPNVLHDHRLREKQLNCTELFGMTHHTCYTFKVVKQGHQRALSDGIEPINGRSKIQKWERLSLYV